MEGSEGMRGERGGKREGEGHKIEEGERVGERGMNGEKVRARGGNLHMHEKDCINFTITDLLVVQI